MDSKITKLIDRLASKDDSDRFDALKSILIILESKVEWFEDVYHIMFSKLSDENSFQRSIGIMVICNLAKSDNANRIEKDLSNILKHTSDEKFITSRQCIQNIWKIAIANDNNGKTIIDHLKTLFVKCEGEKHYNLIRQDILQSLNEICKIQENTKLKTELSKLIEKESNIMYLSKYKTILK
jgi:hypothetical protein